MGDSEEASHIANGSTLPRSANCSSEEVGALLMSPPHCSPLENANVDEEGIQASTLLASFSLHLWLGSIALMALLPTIESLLKKRSLRERGATLWSSCAGFLTNKKVPACSKSSFHYSTPDNGLRETPGTCYFVDSEENDTVVHSNGQVTLSSGRTETQRSPSVSNILNSLNCCVEPGASVTSDGLRKARAPFGPRNLPKGCSKRQRLKSAAKCGPKASGGKESKSHSSKVKLNKNDLEELVQVVDGSSSSWLGKRRPLVDLSKKSSEDCEHRQIISSVRSFGLIFFGSLWGLVWAGLVGNSPQSMLSNVHVLLFWTTTVVLVTLGQLIAQMLRYWTIPELQPEIEQAYKELFLPLRLTKRDFQEALCSTRGVVTLNQHEDLVTEKVTRVDTLSLVLSGRFIVTQAGKALHLVPEHHFVDSPEWFGVSLDDHFQITATALEETKVLVWHRDKLKLILQKHAFLQSVFQHVIGRDVVKKLVQTNDGGLDRTDMSSIVEDEESGMGNVQKLRQWSKAGGGIYTPNSKGRSWQDSHSLSLAQMTNSKAFPRRAEDFALVEEANESDWVLDELEDETFIEYKNLGRAQEEKPFRTTSYKTWPKQYQTSYGHHLEVDDISRLVSYDRGTTIHKTDAQFNGFLAEKDLKAAVAGPIATTTAPFEDDQYSWSLNLSRISEQDEEDIEPAITHLEETEVEVCVVGNNCFMGGTRV